MDFIDVAKLAQLKQDFDNALTAYQNSFKLYSVNINFTGATGKTFSKGNITFDCFYKTYSDYCYDEVICCIREIEHFNIDMTKERAQIMGLLNPIKEKADV